MSYIRDTHSVIQDTLGNHAEVGAFGALKVAQSTAHIPLTFEYPLDTVHGVKVTSTGTGTNVAQYNGSLLKVQTGGTGTASVESIRAVRYTAGSTAGSYFTAGFRGTRSANTTQLIGIFDAEDGIYVGFSGTDFICAYRNVAVGADVVATSAEFNGEFDIANYIANNAGKVHRFRIKFGYLGVGDITIEIKPDSASREWETVHTFKTDGVLEDRTHIGTPILPMRAEVSSTDGSDVYIVSGSWNAHSYASHGSSTAQDRPFNHTGTRTLATGPIVAFRSKATHGGKTNKVRTKLKYSEFATSSEGLYKISIIRNPTGLDGAWSDISTNSSTFEVNTTLTTYTGGQQAFVTHLAVASSGTGIGASSLDFSSLGLYGLPGDTFVILKEELVGGAGSDINSWGFFWVEEF